MAKYGKYDIRRTGGTEAERAEAMALRIRLWDEYANDRGGYRWPGKFEGEPFYAPYFYEQSLDGTWDGYGATVSTDLSVVEKIAFPELGRKRRIRVTESDQGFVYLS